MKTGNRRRAEKSARRGLLFKLPKVSHKMAAMEASIEAPSAKPQTPASFLLLMMIVVAVVAGAFVYHLHVRFEGVWLGYDTSRARAEKARLLVERRELRLELATLKSPERVKVEATQKLGMTAPEHDQIIPIGRNGKQILASGRPR